MKILLFLIFCLLPMRAFAQETPPVCEGQYLHVSSYGQWQREENAWVLPFQCSDGTEASVVVSLSELPLVGEAVYSVVSAKTEENPFRRFTVPCTAMLKYCNYMTLQEYFGTEETFYQQAYP